jgi:hypothetical protein
MRLGIPRQCNIKSEHSSTVAERAITLRKETLTPPIHRLESPSAAE